MDSLRSLLPTALLPSALLRLRPATPEADSSALSTLPPELILRIASYLPPPSAGAFALCTKHLHSLLATPYLKCPHGHAPFNTASFLQLLEPSLPDHIVCHHCTKLHLITCSKRHIQFTKRCDAKANSPMRSHIHPRFSHVVFQMAMKRYRQGLPHLPLLNLLAFDECSWFGPDQSKTSHLIVDGALLQRQQHVLLAHPNNDLSLRGAKIMICPHVRQVHGEIDYRANAPERYSMVYTTGSVDVDRTPAAAECACGSSSSHEAEDEGSGSGLLRCRECATEFRVDELGVGREGKAFVVTRWKDLGEGRDANDPVWRAHLGEGVVGGGAGVDLREV
ncbi:hypothetical protein ACLOAV_004711 [Pseudogymnoascus australis]